MEMEIIERDFSVCKVKDYSQMNIQADFYFVGKTDEENSLVCETRHVPDNTLEREDGWKAFRIIGVLDFSLVGILSEISALLAEGQIGIFAVSTYNTDYIFVKAEQLEESVKLLSENGYGFVS